MFFTRKQWRSGSCPAWSSETRRPTVGEFRKKPVVIEAIQYRPHENCGEVGRFMGFNDDDDYECEESENDEYAIETLEGVMWAQPGDWIIRGVAGEFYPCKPDIFAATYEPAEPHPVDHVELFTDTTGDHRWRAIARNGEIVATCGEGYRNAAHARAMAERILPGVEIRDEETNRG